MLVLGEEGVGTKIGPLIFIVDDEQCVQLLTEAGEFGRMMQVANSCNDQWIVVLFSYQGRPCFATYDRGHPIPNDNGFTIVATDKEHVKDLVELVTDMVRNNSIEGARRNGSAFNTITVNAALN